MYLFTYTHVTQAFGIKIHSNVNNSAGHRHEMPPLGAIVCEMLMSIFIGN